MDNQLIQKIHAQQSPAQQSQIDFQKFWEIYGQFRNKYPQDGAKKYYMMSLPFLERWQREGSEWESESRDFNDDLVEEADNRLVLKPNLRENIDYVLLSPELKGYIKKKFKGNNIKRTAYNSPYLHVPIYPHKYAYVMIDRNYRETVKKVEDLEVKYVHYECCLAGISKLKSRVFKLEATEGNFAVYLGAKGRLKELATEIKSQNTKDGYSGHKFPSISYGYGQKNKELSWIVPLQKCYNEPTLIQIQQFRRDHVFLFVQNPQPAPSLFQSKVICNYCPNLATLCCLCFRKCSYACGKTCYLRNLKHVTECSYAQPYDYEESKQMEKLDIATMSGLRGLYNQSNYCFMNSALQCLFHSRKLTQYFLKGEYLKSINHCNDEGTFGQITCQYVKLLHRIFVPTTTPSSYSKSNLSFIQSIAKYNPIYRKGEQEDCHEFVCRLIDWLKEDLNRNQVKIQYQQIESRVGQDEQAFKLRTKQYSSSRNWSIIEELMQGWLKSTIRCTSCKQSSVSFDPFLSLQLPITGPIKQVVTKHELIVFYVPHNLGEWTTKIKLFFDTSTIPLQQLQKAISRNFIKTQQLRFYIGVAGKSLIKVVSPLDKSSLKSNESVFCFDYFYQEIENRREVQIKLFFENKVTDQMPEATIIDYQVCIMPLMLSVDTIGTVYEGVMKFLWKRIYTGKQLHRLKLYSYQQSGEFPFHIYVCEDGRLSLLNSQHLQSPLPSIYVQFRPDQPYNLQALKKFYFRQTYAHEEVIERKANLQDCLRVFCREEKLSCGNEWKCNQCNCYCQAYKSISFEDLPQMLILSLSRFKKENRVGDSFSKNSSFVQFPMELNLLTSSYQLYAVSNHYLLSKGGSFLETAEGHYTAFVKSMGSWFQVDDEKVTPIHQKDVCSRHAYLLFYQKVQQHQ